MRVEMPAAQVVEAYPPHAFLPVDQCKGQRACDLVEIEPQKEVWSGVGASLCDRSFGTKDDLLTASGFG